MPGRRSPSWLTLLFLLSVLVLMAFDYPERHLYHRFHSVAGGCCWWRAGLACVSVHAIHSTAPAIENNFSGLSIAGQTGPVRT